MPFKRNCRRVLKKEVIKPGSTSNAASKLDAAKTSNFLFLSSQTINKRLQHIRCQNIKSHPENSGRNFSTPYDHKYKKRPIPTVQISTPMESTIEPQVMASLTMTDSEREIAYAKESDGDLTFYHNKMKKINDLMNWSDKFHNDHINFIKQYKNIIMMHPKMNTPDDGQSIKKKKNKLTLEHKIEPGDDMPTVNSPDHLEEWKKNIDFPLKRWVNINPNLSVPLINPKWPRLDTIPDTAFDSEQAGPSKNHFIA
ncbi:hypothetical protein C1646_752173 [Rhizophagus diaphanus]|nr:hypothetical protein C1646_752173 [Rhizophagus diaphanus] [Rhizophagus sp. MUCL 43196]